MSDYYLYKTHGVQDVIPAWATRMPLGALSCAYSHRDAARRQAEDPQPHQRFRSFGRNCRGASRGARAADRDPWSTDYWNPPTTESQDTRQRIFAVTVAFILAAILAYAGW